MHIACSIGVHWSGLASQCFCDAQDGEPQVTARLTKTEVENFLEASTWKACLRINETEAWFGQES